VLVTIDAEDGHISVVFNESYGIANVRADINYLDILFPAGNIFNEPLVNYN
jgi:hypothetical protein